MEKIKFGSEIFELTPAGATFREENAKVAFILPEGKTYEEIEAAVTGKARIEIIDEQGEVIAAHTGYVYLGSLAKEKDRVIAVKQVKTGESDDGTPIYTNQDVTATVMVALLKKSDIRQDVQANNAKIDYVAMMTGVDMEV